MDINSGISLNAIAATAQVNGDAVTIATLKKAMTIQGQAAASLLEALPEPPRALPEGVGGNLDVTA
jgi:hypothetical protein